MILNPPDNQPLVNLQGLDVLRGLLAIFVVAHHARWLCWIGQAKWQAMEHPWWSSTLANLSAVFRYGHEAVMVFFALSGFLIHLRAANQWSTQNRIEPVDMPEFIRRRLHRLAAPYFFVLLLTFSLDSAGQHYFPRLYLGHTPNELLNQNFSGGNYSARAVLPAIIMLPCSLDLTFGSNGPLWSLAFEVIYYSLYPMWLSIRRRSLSLAYIGVPAFCLILDGYMVGGWLPTVLSHWPIWIAGAGLAEWLMKLNHVYLQEAKTGQTNAKEWGDAGSSIGARASLCALGFTLAVAGFIGCQILRTPIESLLSYMALGSGLVLAFCTLPARIERFRFFSVWQFFGIRSYTIYILHFPVLTLIASSLYVQGGPPAGGWFAIAAAISTVLICIVAFECCERHFIHARICVEGGPASL